MEPLWIGHARGELGTKEFAGDPDNPRIIKYWNEAGLANAANGNDEVPWCAAFVGAMLKRANVIGSGKANARSYEEWGRRLLTPVLGCVVVFSRPPTAWQGHVAFYLGTDKTNRRVQVIGGNQSDSVSVSSFSFDRVVAYRWPTAQLIQPEWVGPIPVAGSSPLSTSEA